MNKDLINEIATRETALEFDAGSFLTALPDPDPILRKKGEYASVLEELTADEQVCTAIQQRKLKTLLKSDYRFTPGAASGEEPTAEAEVLCAALTQDLERVDMYNLISEILDAPYHGHTICEVLWEPGGMGAKLVNVVAKPRRWFGYDSDNQLVFLGVSLAQSQPVPQYKFVHARHFPTYDNPYGLRLLSRCLWPVAFKKGGVRWWIRFAERYGLPWTIGEATGQMNKAERDEHAASLRRMVEDAVAVVSGLKLHVHEVSGKGEIHRGLVQYWDAAIAKVLVGQTLTSDVGSGGTGSYALGKTHYQVLDDFAGADAALVTSFFNDLAWTYGQVNAPGVLTPVFAYDEPEDQAARADLDKKLYGTGVRFRKSHYVRKYGLAEEDFELASEAASADSMDDSAFAAGDERQDAQDSLDGLADSMLGDAGRIMQRQADALLRLVDQAESFEDAQILLAEALGPDADDELAKHLASGMVNAELLGRWAVAHDSEGGES